MLLLRFYWKQETFYEKRFKLIFKFDKCFIHFHFIYKLVRNITKVDFKFQHIIIFATFHNLILGCRLEWSVTKTNKTVISQGMFVT